MSAFTNDRKCARNTSQPCPTAIEKSLPVGPNRVAFRQRWRRGWLQLPGVVLKAIDLVFGKEKMRARVRVLCRGRLRGHPFSEFIELEQSNATNLCGRTVARRECH